MRLTLRTLLAYLDDTLEPAQARLIGQKVAESEPAQELIGRIKQVTRRRRLTTPPATGPGARLDANTIAEYVDNVLPAEQLAELEETCLASDVHLAEVAACHQILTLVLGEPMLVPPTARQRMYALKKGREAKRHRSPAASGIGQGAVDGTAGGEDTEGLFLGSALTRPGSSLRWLVPLTAAVLLVAAALAIWQAMTNNGLNVAATRGNQPEPEQPQVAGVDLKDKAKPANESNNKKEAPEVKTVVQPEIKPGETAQKQAKTETKTEPAKKPEEPLDPKKEEATELAKVLPPRPERRELGKYVLATPGVLLQRGDEKAPWQRVRPENAINSAETLLSLPGYRNELRLDSGVRLVLWGNLPEGPRIKTLESAVMLHTNPAFDLDFTLDRGRVLLSNLRKEGAARVRIRFRDEVWDVTLSDQTTEVAMELRGNCSPYVRDLVGGEPDFFFVFWCLKGESQLKVRYEERVVFSPSIVFWDSITGMREGPNKLERLPEWWASKVLAKSVVQSVLDGLARRLTAKDSIDVAIAEMMKDPDASSRYVALLCLGAMGDLSDLLDGLNNDRYPEVAVMARRELIYFLGLNAKNDEKLLKILARKSYVDVHAQTVMQLLHGFAKEQWDNPSMRAIVVEYLNHEKLVIRHLTYMLLLEMEPTGASIAYRPTADSGQRERGAEEWRRFLLGNRVPAKSENSKKKGQ